MCKWYKFVKFQKFFFYMMMIMIMTLYSQPCLNLFINSFNCSLSINLSILVINQSINIHILIENHYINTLLVQNILSSLLLLSYSLSAHSTHYYQLGLERAEQFTHIMWICAEENFCIFQQNVKVQVIISPLFDFSMYAVQYIF